MEKQKQYTPKSLLCTPEQYASLREIANNALRVPDAKGGTLEWCKPEADRDINGNCIFQFTSEIQRVFDEKGIVLTSDQYGSMVDEWEVIKRLPCMN
jgi:hypothetical protein